MSRRKDEGTHMFAWNGDPHDSFDRPYCLCGLVKDHKTHEMKPVDDPRGRAILGENDPTNEGEH